MKHFSSTIAALTIASTLIAPCATLAQGNDRPEGNKEMRTMRTGNKTIDYICSGTTSTPMIREVRAQINLAEKMAKKDLDLAKKNDDRKADYAFKSAKNLLKSDSVTHTWYGKKYAKKTMNDAEKKAINTYASSVQMAVDARNAAIKTANDTEKAATASAAAARKTAIDAAIAARKVAVDAAIATLKTKCSTTGADRIAAEKAFKDAVSSARKTYQDAVKIASKAYLTATKPAREVRAAAVKVAQTTYKAAIKVAKEKLMTDLKAAKTITQ